MLLLRRTYKHKLLPMINAKSIYILHILKSVFFNVNFIFINAKFLKSY